MFQKEELTLVNCGLKDAKNAYKAFLFGPSTVPDLEKGIIAQAENALYGCRDALGASIRTLILDKSNQLTLDKTRWLFYWSCDNNSDNHAPLKSQHKENMEWCERGLRILHACEKLAGWPMTKAWHVKGPKEYQSIVHTLSSRRWIKSPYLITLYVLLMRIAADERITDFKNFDELEKKIADLNQSGKNIKRDSGHVRVTLPWWRFILRGYPDLFRQYKLPYYWSLERVPGVGHNGYGEGISRLCDGSTKFTAARDKLRKIKAKLEEEK